MGVLWGFCVQSCPWEKSHANNHCARCKRRSALQEVSNESIGYSMLLTCRTNNLEAMAEWWQFVRSSIAWDEGGSGDVDKALYRVFLCFYAIAHKRTYINMT